MEARLFEAGTIPDFTTREFFEAHPWVAPIHQIGHAERTAMVADLVRDFVAQVTVGCIADLGCGDGSLLASIGDLGITSWGYDAGTGNVQQAAESGLDVRQADLFSPDLEYGDLIICTEVLEHLVDPHGFVASLPGDKLILSSPSAETADWHYEHHAWAWDVPGYTAMVTAAGWTVVETRECETPPNHHGGVTKPQRFQAVAAIK